MNEMEISFGSSPWEDYLDSLTPGGRVSAAQFLTLLEGETEEALEDALLELESGAYELDISDLPKYLGGGESALRQRKETQLVKAGLRPEGLEETDPLRLYLEELAQRPAFGDEDLLAQHCAEGEESAMGPLTDLGLSRVVTLAQEYVGRGVLLMDLIQEGSLGLWQAVGSYAGGDYAAYRDRHIRFAMAKAVTMQARAGGTGEKLRIAMEDYRAVDERLLGELGRNPTIEEIADALHMSPEDAEIIRKTLEDARNLASIKRQPEPEEEEQAEQQAVEDTAQFQMRQRILDLLSALSGEDAKLLTLRFGLEGGKPLTPEEAGRKLGLTPQEVTAREAAALAKLRGKT